MRKNGLADGTIHSRIQALKQLARTTNLIDTEQVKECIYRRNGQAYQKEDT
jgi:hypothetical protein